MFTRIAAIFIYFAFLHTQCNIITHSAPKLTKEKLNLSRWKRIKTLVETKSSLKPIHTDGSLFKRTSTHKSNPFIHLMHQRYNDGGISTDLQETCQINCTRIAYQTRGIEANCSHLGIKHLSQLCIPNVNLSDIASLNLGWNDISTIENGAFVAFSNLVELKIEGNKINRLENDSFSGLNKLKILNLQSNKINLTRATFPENLFKPISTTLHTLLLNNNTHEWERNTSSQTYPDWALSSLTSLCNLYIDGLPRQAFGPGFASMTALKTLYLSGYNGYCYMHELTNHTFENLSQLEYLIIKRCSLHIDAVEYGTLAPLTRLKKLDVSRNVDLDINGLIPLLHGQRNSRILKRLNVNLIVKPYSPSRCVSNRLAAALPRSLTYLDATSNNLEVLSDQVFDLLPQNLTSLTINSNRFFFGDYLKNMSKMSNLEVLKMNGYNRGFDLPRYYDPQSIPVDSDCTFGHLEKKEYFHFQLPPKLTRLELAFASMNVMFTKFTFNTSNSLEHLILTGNNIPYLLGPISGLNKLKELELGNNNIKYISKNFFKYFPNLQKLILSENNCGEFFQNKSLQLDFPKSLRHLNLSKNALKGFDVDFHNMYSIRHLILNHCDLETFTADLKGAKNLKILNISYNSIYTIPRFVTDTIDSMPNLEVDISFNDIGCYCGNVYFLEWIVNFPRLKESNLLQLSCEYGHSVERVEDFRLKIEQIRRMCASNKMQLAVSAILTGIACCVIIIVLVYRYRWKLLFWCYSIYLRYTSSKTQPTGANKYPKDVYVNYCSADANFAENVLACKLENLGCRLHLCGRDDRAGMSKFRNISLAIRESRRTLAILSPQFSKDSWCRAAILFAAKELLDSDRSILAFLILPSFEIDSRHMELFYHIQQNERILFPSPEDCKDEQIMDLFWKRVHRKLLCNRKV